MVFDPRVVPRESREITLIDALYGSFLHVANWTPDLSRIVATIVGPISLEVAHTSLRSCNERKSLIDP